MTFKRIFLGGSPPLDPDELPISRPGREPLLWSTVLLLVWPGISLFSWFTGTPGAAQPWFFPYILILWHGAFIYRIIQIIHQRARRLFFRDQSLQMHTIFGQTHLAWDQITSLTIVTAFSGYRVALRTSMAKIAFAVESSPDELIALIDARSPDAFILDFAFARFFAPARETQTGAAGDLAAMLTRGVYRSMFLALIWAIVGTVFLCMGLAMLYRLSCWSAFVGVVLGLFIYSMASANWSQAKSARTAVINIQTGHLPRRSPTGQTPGLHKPKPTPFIPPLA